MQPLKFMSREFLLKTLEVCKNSGLLVPELVDSSGSLRNQSFRFGPLGVFLRHNIYSSWWEAMVTKSEHCMFPVNGDAAQTPSDTAKELLHLLPLNEGRIPIGLASVNFQAQVGTWRGGESAVPDEQVASLLPSLITPDYSTRVMGAWLMTSKMAANWFTVLQRNRRFWWRKNTVQPEHISTSDTKIDKDNAQIVSVQLETESEKFSIEDICWHGEAPVTQALANLHEMNIQIKEGRKTVMPHLITSTCSLDTCAWVYITDALQQKLRRGKPVSVLQFSPHLAPYKLAVVNVITSSEGRERLPDLRLSLSKEFKKAGVSVLDMANSPSSQEKVYSRFDEMGIPFTVILSEETLKSGLTQLRSRDTTIKEDIHLSDLRAYIGSLLKIK